MMCAYKTHSVSASILLLRQLWQKQAARGVNLSIDQLRQHARDRDWHVPGRQHLRHMRNELVPTAQHGRVRKAKKFMSFAVHNLGQVFLDVAYHEMSHSKENRGAKYFLAFVEAFSGRAYIYGMRNRQQSEWYNAIKSLTKSKHMAGIKLTTLNSDLDASINSRQFQKKIKEEFQLNWHVLRVRNKSMYAERLIS